MAGYDANKQKIVIRVLKKLTKKTRDLDIFRLIINIFDLKNEKDETWKFQDDILPYINDENFDEEKFKKTLRKILIDILKEKELLYYFLDVNEKKNGWTRNLNEEKYIAIKKN